METRKVSRRRVLLAGLGAGAAMPSWGAAGLTAGQVIERIRAQVGVPWRAETVDKIVAGSADTPVRGIATTMMATLDVIQRAATAGRNLVITHEPTFYAHLDQTEPLAQDATYQFKANFIREHQVVVFRFHDHWHARRPDGIATGMMRELGWEKQAASAENPRRFVFSNMTLGQLAKEMQTKLPVRTMRVVGDPKLPVQRVAANWGYTAQGPGMAMLARPDVDVLIAGEAREWEVVEYAQDLIASGQKKGLIVLGHVVSEQAGMKYCAEWLKGFVTEVPVEFVPAAEPFWSAGA